MRSVIVELMLWVGVVPATNLSPLPINAMLWSGGDFLRLQLILTLAAELMHWIARETKANP